MKKNSKTEVKVFNITTLILELAIEILLLPFHIVSTILNVIKEIKR